MILVIDKTISDRATALRRRLLDLRFPCAVSSLEEACSLTPAFCIVSFVDMLDQIRHKPLDHIPAYVLGEGFVNSALNARPVADYEELYGMLKERILHCLCASETCFFGRKGYILKNSFIVTEDCIYYKGVPLLLDTQKHRVLQYLLFRQGESCSLRQIGAYCFPVGYEDAQANTIRVHIANINRTAAEQTGRKIIANKREIGYRLEIQPVIIYK